MITHKKGLSTVVTTLIIILLVLVAIGIVWVVIRGFTEGGASTVKYNAMCLEVDVRATALTCESAGTNCNFTLTRKSGGESISGVKLVFKNSTGANSVKDRSGNIIPLQSVSNTTFETNVTKANMVEVTAYFVDETGTQRICTITNPYGPF